MTRNNNFLNPNYKPSGYYSCLRSEMLDFIPRECKKILDVGCGEGHFGELLKDSRNAEVWGVEVCNTAAMKAKKRLDTVINADFENDKLDLPNKYFDCIIFNDALEHFLYPWIVLRSSRSYLKDSGYFIGSIPNIRSFAHIKNLLLKQDWLYTNGGILDKTHMRFFTKKSASRMLEENGFKVIKTQGILPCFSFKFELLNLILLNSIEDMRYFQFAYVANLKVKDAKY